MEMMEEGAGDMRDHDLRSTYGSLLLTMYSLWKAVTGGDDWSSFCDPLFEISSLMGVIFVMFIAFVVCAVMNVVTSIFVDKALKAAEGDMDLVIIANNKERQEHIHAVKCVFEKADLDSSGCLTREEFADHFNNPYVQTFFKGLDLDLDGIEPDQLFTLLDFNGDEAIHIDEFISGCCTMKGAARSLDLARLTHNFNKHEDMISNLVVRLGASTSQSLKHHTNDLMTLKKTLEEIAVNGQFRQAEQATVAADSSLSAASPTPQGLSQSPDPSHSPLVDQMEPKESENMRTTWDGQIFPDSPSTVRFQVFFGEEVKSLGFQIEWRMPIPMVGHVDQNGEAEARGIHTGDLIEVVNDQETEGLFRGDLLPNFKIRPLTLQLCRPSWGAREVM